VAVDVNKLTVIEDHDFTADMVPAQTVHLGCGCPAFALARSEPPEMFGTRAPLWRLCIGPLLLGLGR
jgi:hypothetical protein